MPLEIPAVTFVTCSEIMTTAHAFRRNHLRDRARLESLTGARGGSLRITQSSPICERSKR